MSADKQLQPTLDEMMSRYLQKRTAAQTARIAASDLPGEVAPYDAAPVQPVEPRIAWEEALAATRFLYPQCGGDCEPPPDWPTLVSTHEPEMSLAFAHGNFPQMVRDLHGLIQAEALTSLQPGQGRPTELPGLIDWARRTLQAKRYPEALLGLGALRLARQFQAADDLIRKHQKDVPAEWQAAWANEQAALAWHRGDVQEAARLWRSQPESAPVLFNRGMAALFLGQPGEARKLLHQAAQFIPESSAWHHLARLYLALAEMR